MEEVKIEKAEWNLQGRVKSKIRLSLENMEVGDCIKIHHPNLKCEDRICSFYSLLANVRKDTGYKYQSYHEAPHIVVVRRIA